MAKHSDSWVIMETWFCGKFDVLPLPTAGYVGYKSLASEWRSVREGDEARYYAGNYPPVGSPARGEHAWPWSAGLSAGVHNSVSLVFTVTALWISSVFHSFLLYYSHYQRHKPLHCYQPSKSNVVVSVESVVSVCECSLPFTGTINKPLLRRQWLFSRKFNAYSFLFVVNYEKTMFVVFDFRLCSLFNRTINDDIRFVYKWRIFIGYNLGLPPNVTSALLYRAPILYTDSTKYSSMDIKPSIMVLVLTIQFDNSPYKQGYY